MLAFFKTNKYDREYQIWERETLSIELITESLFIEKLGNINYNPLRAGLCEKHYHSSAKFYYDGTNSFGVLKHYSGN